MNDFENALLWNAIGRDDQLMDLILKNCNDHEKRDLYFKFKNLNDKQVNFDLEKFCTDLKQVEIDQLKIIQEIEIKNNEEYQNKLKSILNKFTEGYRGKNLIEG